MQSTVNTNPGLNFNLLFWFMHFCSTVHLKILKNKSSIDPEKICGKSCTKLTVRVRFAPYRLLYHFNIKETKVLKASKMTVESLCLKYNFTIRERFNILF